MSEAGEVVGLVGRVVDHEVAVSSGLQVGDALI